MTVETAADQSSGTSIAEGNHAGYHITQQPFCPPSHIPTQSSLMRPEKAWEVLEGVDFDREPDDCFAVSIVVECEIAESSALERRGRGAGWSLALLVRGFALADGERCAIEQFAPATGNFGGELRSGLHGTVL